MTDNRFAYMRKHLGLSQKDAAQRFNVRHDTVKKWDADRLHVPEQVLEDLFNLIARTKELITDTVEELLAYDDELGSITEFFLLRPDEPTRHRFDLPKSDGWTDHVLGGIIGGMPSSHVYVVDKLPEHYDVALQWFELWEDDEIFTSNSEIAIGSESKFLKDLERSIKFRCFEVAHGYDEASYFLGFPAVLSNKTAKTVWIKGLSAGRFAEMDVFSSQKPAFVPSEDSDLPFIYGSDGERVLVGLPPDQKNTGPPADAFALAALIFERLEAEFSSGGDLLKACRKIEQDRVGDHGADAPEGLNEWDLVEKFHVSQNFLVSMFLAAKEQLGFSLIPEGMAEIAKIIARSEPVHRQIDQQVLVISLGEIEVSVLLDLRDLKEGSGQNSTARKEFENAMSVILALLDNGDVATMSAFSEFNFDRVSR